MQIDGYAAAGGQSEGVHPPPVPPMRGCLPAWEEPGPFLGAFFKTTGQILLHPGLTLSQPAFPGYVSLLAFALPWLVFESAISVLYGSVFEGQAFAVLAMGQSIALNLFVSGTWVLLLHLALLVVRADKGGFQATFRSQAYLCCLSCWLIIPGIGFWIMSVWVVVALFLGLAASHQVGKLKILAALLVLIAMLASVAMLAAIFVGLASVLHMLGALREVLRVGFGG